MVGGGWAVEYHVCTAADDGFVLATAIRPKTLLLQPTFLLSNLAFNQEIY